MAETRSYQRVPGHAGIAYRAAPAVQAVIDAVGRTEDVKISPSGRRLAVASFARGRIAVFEIDISLPASGPHVTLERAAEFSSPELRYPHGLDFLDDETLVVANRFGRPAMFKLPAGDIRDCPSELMPLYLVAGSDDHLLQSPASLCIVRQVPGPSELLICNNFGHSVTRHRLDSRTGAIGDGELLLRKGLLVPDGVTVSADQKWIAVSNHNTNGVLVYANTPSLGEQSDPDGILRGVHYPHGLCFTADGRYLLVADAGAPLLHIYEADAQGWLGVRNPVRSLQIMDEATFARGRKNPQEGGPKGIDIDPGQAVLVATSECQPLAFFDLAQLLEPAAPHWSAGGGPAAMRYELHLLEQAGQIWSRLKAAEIRAAKAEAGYARARKKLKRIPKLLRRLFLRRGKGK